MTTPGIALPDALDRARTRLTDWAPPDLAGRVATELAVYALARLHYLEESLGFEASASSVVGPDSSPSRNPDRLAGGYSTGGEVWWPAASQICPLDTLPNCCGIAFAAVDAREPIERYHDRLIHMASSPPTLDGRPLIIDINRKNHFVGLFADDQERTFAAVHCSAPEFKAGSRTEFGLSVSESARLRQLAHTMMTPAGPVTNLPTSHHEEFFTTIDTARRFARRKRQVILETVFGEADILSDRQHQGYVTPQHMVLGSQSADGTPASEYLYLLGPDRDSYLVTPAAPTALSQEPSEGLAAIPHGGGYNYATDFTAATVDYNEGSGFTFTLATNTGTKLVAPSLDHLPFTYRGKNNLDHSEALNICTRHQALSILATMRTR